MGKLGLPGARLRALAAQLWESIAKFSKKFSRQIVLSAISK
jgi:hypothetical protein